MKAHVYLDYKQIQLIKIYIVNLKQGFQIDIDNTNNPFPNVIKLNFDNLHELKETIHLLECAYNELNVINRKGGES